MRSGGDQDLNLLKEVLVMAGGNVVPVIIANIDDDGTSFNQKDATIIGRLGTRDRRVQDLDVNEKALSMARAWPDMWPLQRLMMIIHPRRASESMMLKSRDSFHVKDLSAMDVNGRCEPYVEVEPNNYERTTKHHEKTLKLVWNHVFASPREQLQFSVLEIMVKYACEEWDHPLR
ncbi:hypothetical protein EJ110_NYTH56400 [Nymphaea thermarum]|nr:hypothetical protein EJ110_NYTH56400 [Nymphaea thermarum]